MLETRKSFMTSPNRTRLIGSALLLASLQLGLSQTLTNTFYFGPSFTPPTPVWDVTGVYQITNHMESHTIRPMDIVFNQIGLDVDAHGKLQALGNPTVLVQVGDDMIGGDYKVSGMMSGGGANTHASFSIRFKGSGTVGGVATTCNISANYNLRANPADLTLVGKTTGSVTFSHLGTGSFNSNISLPLPPGADGGWNVTLDLVPFKTKLSGTAVVLVDTWTNTPSTTLATKVAGTAAKSGVANVNLTGYGNSAGTQINMVLKPVVGDTNVIAKVNGRVLGQRVKN
jgi:hypothetical protein